MPHPIVDFALDALRAAGVAVERTPAPEELAGLFAELAADDPSVGLRAGASARFRATNPVVYLMMSSPSLGAAFAGLGRFAVVLLGRDTKLDAASRSGDVTLAWHGTPGPYGEFVAATLVSLCGWVVGRAVVPRRVELRGPRPVDTRPFVDALGVFPSFDAPRNAVVLTAGDWAAPSAHNDPALYALHREFLEQKRRRFADEEIVARVRDRVAAGSSLQVDLEAVARALGMSPRTLQRRLRAEGTRFGDIVDGVRKEQVLLLLRTSDAALESVARRSGFTDARALRRAFKRWTGTTPAAWRAALRT